MVLINTSQTTTVSVKLDDFVESRRFHFPEVSKNLQDCKRAQVCKRI